MDSGYKGVIIRLRGYFEGCKIVSENRSQEGEKIFVKVAYALVFPHCGAKLNLLLGMDIFSDWTGSVGGVYVGVKYLFARLGIYARNI